MAIDASLIGSPEELFFKPVTFFNPAHGAEEFGQIAEVYEDNRGLHLSIDTGNGNHVPKEIPWVRVGLVERNDSGDVKIGINRGEVLIIHQHKNCTSPSLHL